MGISDWDAFRKQARNLENDIDLKLVAYSKVGGGSAGGGGGGSGSSTSSDSVPLLGEQVFDSLSIEIEDMLERLSALNEKMSDLPATGTAMMHTLQRHRDILNGYRQEFSKIQANHTTRIEREELLRGSGIHATAGTSSSPSSSGLSRRDMYLKENTHINSSQNLINDQINIAMETKEHLMSQRHQFKRLQTRFNDLSNRFPVISSLMQRIHIRKRLHSLIIGSLIGICIILSFVYAYH